MYFNLEIYDFILFSFLATIIITSGLMLKKNLQNVHDNVDVDVVVHDCYHLKRNIEPTSSFLVCVCVCKKTVPDKKNFLS